MEKDQTTQPPTKPEGAIPITSEHSELTYHTPETPLMIDLLNNPKELSHPLATLFKDLEFKPMGEDLAHYSYLIIEKPQDQGADAQSPDLITSTSKIRTAIYSRVEAGDLIFDPTSQQGQIRKWSLNSPVGKNPLFLKFVATKMSLNHIGIVKLSYEGHKSDLTIKDDQGYKQKVENSDVYYFIYIHDEIKSKAGTGATKVVNFDKYQLKKDEAAALWKAGKIEEAAKLWHKTFKQVKSCLSKAQRKAMKPELQAQWKTIKQGCIRNTLRAYWKLKEIKEGNDIFLANIAENDQDVKFLSLGFEFMLELAQLEEFKSEISRIKNKYTGKEFIPKNEWDKPKESNPELILEIEDLEKVFLAKFKLKQKKENDSFIQNFQNSMWSQDANKNYEQEQLIRERMQEMQNKA